MAGLRNVFQSIWSSSTDSNVRGTPLAALLSVLSYPYAGVIALRNRMYDKGTLPRHRLPCRVVSVGNLSVGGTGKTPFVIFLAGILRQKGFRPCVLSRGYGSAKTSTARIVSDGVRIQTRYPESGDEPFLIARSLSGVPVIVGADRIATGKTAIDRFGADVLVLDDAFQHRRLYRDVDIVLVDADRPFGNGYLLPRGPLREPRESIRRADMIVRIGLTERAAPADLIAAVGGFPMKILFGRRAPKDLRCGKDDSLQSLDVLRNRSIAAFAGIASPDSFRMTLESLQAKVVCFLPFPDHHLYRDEDIAKIQREARKAGAEAIVTTEKDGARLESFSQFLPAVKQLRIAIAMSPAERPFVETLMGLLHREAKDHA